MTLDQYKAGNTTGTIYSEIVNRSKQYPDRTALIGRGGEGNRYTYSDLTLITCQLATGLHNKNLLARKEIGLISENRPEWGIAYLAILAAGGTVVPIDANLKSNEISHIIDHAQIDVIFCSERFEEVIRGFGRNLTIISLEDNSSHGFKTLLNTDTSQLTPTPNNLAILIYTSGTTGDPKTVELTHNNILSNLIGLENSLDIFSSDIFLSLLPLHHTFEATCGFLTPLFAGSSIVYARSLKSKEILEDIKNNNVTCMCGVPLLFEKLYQTMARKIASSPLSKRTLFKSLYYLSASGWRLKRKWGRTLFRQLRDKAGIGSVRLFVSGAAAIPPRIGAFFNYLGFDFVQGYGLTECSPAVAFNRPDDINFGSVGPPLANVEIKIDNPDASGVGEIIVRGGNVTPGYRGNPEETAKLVRNGWLYTGDLGQFKRGHLYITGRVKNLIVSAAGKNIYPEQIEEKLTESDCILEAIVFGRPKQNKQGEEVRAVIVPDLDGVERCHAISTNPPEMEKIKKVVSDIVQEVNNNIADYKRISGFDIQLDELEKTTTKKVKRFLYK